MSEKRYIRKFCLKEICEIIGVDIPEKYASIGNEVFSNLSYSDKFIEEGGAYFLNAHNREEASQRMENAIREKAKFVFVESVFADCHNIDQLPHIAIKNTMGAVAKIGSQIRDSLGIKVVGITGSLGKTTTKDMIYSVLSCKYKTKKSFGNQNTIIPLFANLQMMEKDVEFFVQEFGAGHPDAMPRTVDACIPDAGVITCISDPHLEAFGSRENILNEKLRMIKKMPKGCPAFFNYDDELLKKVELQDYPIISFAINNKGADYYAENIKELDEYITFDIVSKNARNNVTLNLRGKHNIYNALVAYAIGVWAGMKPEEIIRGIASFKSTGVRQNVVNIGGYNLFIDCYNIAPASVVSSIEILSNIKVEEGGRRIAIISDILKLGDAAEKLHIDVARQVAKLDVDIVYCFGEELAVLMTEELKRLGKEAYCTYNREQLNSWVRENVTRKDVVLFKGVRVLIRTVDQVFGTSLHTTMEDNYYWHDEGDYRVRVLCEVFDDNDKLNALITYKGNEDAPTIPGYCLESPVFTIGPKCFRDNQKIKVANIPEPIFNISNGAFRDCKSLEQVTLPSTLKVIDPNAFRGCESLTSIVIPEGVIDVGENAFRKCTNLRSVTIPSTVAHIGDSAFPKTGKIKFTVNDNAYAEEYIKKLVKDSSLISKVKRKIKKQYASIRNLMIYK